MPRTYLLETTEPPHVFTATLNITNIKSFKDLKRILIETANCLLTEKEIMPPNVTVDLTYLTKVR